MSNKGIFMNIIYDARWSGSHGIGRFSDEIKKNLDVLFYNDTTSPSSPFDPIRLALKIPRKISKSYLFLSPGYNGPLFGTNFILTIHDLNHIDRHENSNFLKKLYYHTVLRFLVHRSVAILTVSEFSKNRIVKWFKVDSSKVHNIGNGVSEVFNSTGNTFNNLGEYILSVSNRKLHKNEVSLLKAFARADISFKTKLILTGEPNKHLIRLARNLRISDRIIFSGKLSEDDLAALYRGSIMMVFPSLYEGFGLPIVEAFACGTPVITSNVSAMPEIAGSAALLVNPLNVEEISSAISRLYAAPELRNMLREGGKLRASYYTWDKVTARLKSILDSMK